ncbi:hypothetical protein RDWZM_002241 [Blomia tropicalis]|uniref:2-phosphoxylose phosphatase 1 n=1 Tax=Blomia tropicalis TaxID=40697 RepID=A0A9Q0MD53_BLOTA|nr:hypothetical protein RDWZM_002241 [Blomia tropicalis]
MYRLGHYLRRRYVRNFHWNISPRDLYVRSSAMERCQESAQALIAGLLPPTDDWCWNDDLGTVWQPIPIATIPRNEDGLLVASSNCDRAYALYGRIPDSKVVQNLIKPFWPTIQEIAHISNVSIDSYRKARDVYDSLLCIRHQMKITSESIQDTSLYWAQSWITEEQFSALKSVYELGFRFDFTGTIETELRRLRTGLLLNEIVNRLNPMVDHPKISIFSAHDTTLFHLLDSLEFKPNKTVNFGSTVIFEARQVESQATATIRAFRVNVKYPNDYFVVDEFHLPGNNGTFVELQTLKHNLEPLLISNMDQWKRECSNLWGVRRNDIERGKREL